MTRLHTTSAHTSPLLSTRKRPLKKALKRHGCPISRSGSFSQMEELNILGKLSFRKKKSLWAISQRSLLGWTLVAAELLSFIIRRARCLAHRWWARCEQWRGARGRTETSEQWDRKTSVHALLSNSTIPGCLLKDFVTSGKHERWHYQTFFFF